MREKYCEICGERPADIEYIEIIDGTKHVKYLCNVCAEKEANGVRLVLTEEVNINSGLVCPNCGTPLAYVKTSLQIGCPHCYNVFEGAIKDLLKKLQGSTSFIGREDLKSSEEKDLIVIKHRLKKELEKAVQNEEFERAAKLRDEINSINQKLKWLGSNPSE